MAQKSARRPQYRCSPAGRICLLLRLAGCRYRRRLQGKNLCSGVFVSQRDPQVVLREDLAGVLDLITTEIDAKGKSVSAAFALIPRQRAIFREGLGCTLLIGADEAAVRVG